MELSLLPVPVLIVTVFPLIRAEYRVAWRHIYQFKPVSTFLMILVVVLSFAWPRVRTGFTAGVLVGLALSMSGDVSLMFESKMAFMSGPAFDAFHSTSIHSEKASERKLPTSACIACPSHENNLHL